MVVDASALVAADATIGPSSSIGPFCVVGFDGQGDAIRIGAEATIRSHVVLYRGSTFGDRLHVGHGALVRELTIVGDDVSIGSHSIVEHHVAIEDRVRLHSRCFVPEFSVLREGAWIGPGVVLTNARYPNRPETKANLEGVTVGRNAVVGAGVVVLPGVTIGDGAVIGAGAVVVHDVEPGATVVGSPAKPVT